MRAASSTIKEDTPLNVAPSRSFPFYVRETQEPQSSAAPFRFRGRYINPSLVSTALSRGHVALIARSNHNEKCTVIKYMMQLQYTYSIQKIIQLCSIFGTYYVFI